MSTQYTRPGSSSTAAAAKDMANAAEDKISETVEQAQVMAREQYDKLTASIRRNPLQAAGIAAGVGFVLALLARR